MHEMSIALSILDEVEKHAKTHNAKNIEELVLEIGDLAGIEIDALSFALEAIRKKSILADTIYKIETLNGKANCLECGKNFIMKELYDTCPECNSYFKDITEGKELKIKSITLIN
jgi:hydrogenase nickel incorporation protein HypA/HybF